jgi:hypothetical protein
MLYVKLFVLLYLQNMHILFCSHTNGPENVYSYEGGCLPTPVYLFIFFLNLPSRSRLIYKRNLFT